MKIFIATYGSRGDVQPYLALGKGLKKAGHEVTLATSVRFREFVESHGLNYGYMNDALLAIVDTDQGKEIIENTATPFDMFCQAVKLKKQMAPLQEALLAESWEAAQTTDPGLVIFHPKAVGGPHFAEKLKIPAVLALPLPMLVPSAARPHAGFPDLGLKGEPGHIYNRLTCRMVNLLMFMSARAHISAWRRSVGLSPVRSLDLLRQGDGTPVPVLNGFSSHVVPPAPDWPDRVFTTGYWFLDTHGDPRSPEPELADFLKAGPPPVYIGFGSMPSRAPEKMAAIAVEALTQTGARGILATGWGGLKAESLPRGIIQVSHLPHDRLFPRMAAVVHHGGAGTTAAGLRAGKPSVIVPFFGDQPFWAQRVHALGAGPAPVPRKELTAETLARAIGRALSSSRIKAAARHMGEKLSREDGIGNAVRILETIAKKGNS